MKNKALGTIFLIVLIDLLGFGIILPLLPFIAEKFGGNPFEIGLLGATYSFFQLVSSPILGRLSDRFGRKKILIISQAGSALGYILLGFSNSLPLIFLSRAVDGATGGNISIAQAYIADVTSPKERTKGMGFIGAAFGIGFIFGPIAGGLLSKISFGTPAFFAAGISLLTILTTSLFLKESINLKKAEHSKKTKFSLSELKRTLNTYPLGILIVTFFLLNFGFSLLQGTFALWTQNTFGFGVEKNGYLFAYIGILAVIMQLQILPFLIKKYPEKRLLVFSTFSLALGLFLIPVLPHPDLLYFSLLFISFGNGLSNPVIQSLASENVPKEEYGGTLGFLQSSGSLGRILGPAIGGAIFNVLGKNSPFFFGAALVFLVFLYLRRNLRDGGRT